MNIKRTENKKPFGELCIGTVFSVGGKVYIKTPLVEIKELGCDWSESNALLLNVPEYDKFLDTTVVDIWDSATLTLTGD